VHSAVKQSELVLHSLSDGVQLTPEAIVTHFLPSQTLHGSASLAFCSKSCFWPTKTTPAPTAPTKSKIPKIVAIILPLFFFCIFGSAIIGGISKFSGAVAGAAGGMLGTSATSGKERGGVLGRFWSGI